MQCPIARTGTGYNASPATEQPQNSHRTATKPRVRTRTPLPAHGEYDILSEHFRHSASGFPMQPKSKVILASLLILISISAYMYAESQSAKRSEAANLVIQHQSVPSLRLLEQMRYGIVRTVSSTSELIVLNLPQLFRTEGEEAEEEDNDPETEVGLIEQGEASFSDAYNQLQALRSTYANGELSQIPMKEIYEAYSALQTTSRNIIQKLKSETTLAEILSLKEQFEEQEQRALSILNTALDAEQRIADAAFTKQSSSIKNLHNDLLILGTALIALLVFYAFYVISTLNRESAARRQAEQLANEKAQEVKRRELLEASLASHQKLEALGTMLGGIAHSVNNVLLPIMTLSKMLQQDFPKESEHGEDLQRIYDSANNASILLKDVMAFSRNDSKPSSNRCEIVSCVSKALGITQAATPASIQIEANISATESWISAKEADIEALLLNLAGNAIDAMDEQTGRLAVRLDNVTLDPESLLALGLTCAPGPAVRLSVSDSGKGIAAEDLSKIFDPFFTTKDVGKGTGLGLSITHTTVKHAGGDIKVSSEINKGTRFDIYFPLKEGSPEQG